MVKAVPTASKASESSRICTKCKILQSASNFHVKKYPTKNGEKDRLHSRCKPCQKKVAADWQKKNRARHNAQQRACYRRKKQGVKRKLRQTHKERTIQSTKYKRERRKNNPTYMMLHNLRNRLGKALKGKCKSATTKALLGCCIEECRKWIEAQFLKGMDWSNIHIDHIIPCASFDMSDPEQQRQCFHYTNLQPLFPKDNLKKSDKITQLRVWTGEKWIN